MLEDLEEDVEQVKKMKMEQNGNISEETETLERSILKF